MSVFGELKSAKASITKRHESIGYGFVTFKNEADAIKALEKGVEGLDIHAFNPKDKRGLRKMFNNLYVKNFPLTWNIPELTELFKKYGNIKSIFVSKY
jgi:RNA recognition motif-containing protein